MTAVLADPLAGADLRLPAHRREVWQRFYTHHLTHATHPGLVYFWLPAIADARDLDADGRAWLAWLNGNTQNPCMSLLLLDAAPTPRDWRAAVAFWAEHYPLMDFDTDRRHQKPRFGEATTAIAPLLEGGDLAGAFTRAGASGWDSMWRFALDLPHLGRLSAWSMIEFARILLGPDAIPDADTLLLADRPGSRSHRNGLGVIAGHDATYWSATDPDPDLIGELEELGASLLAEARTRNPGHPDVGYLSMESALCTYKSWHKPNRRYPNVYADMGYYRLRKAEARFGDRFGLLWDARAARLPARLRLEATPTDPGLDPVKQNHYRLTGEVPMLFVDFPGMESSFDRAVADGRLGLRKDLRP